VSRTPFVVQLLTLPHVTLSPAVPTAASPSKVAGAAVSRNPPDASTTATAEASERVGRRRRCESSVEVPGRRADLLVAIRTGLRGGVCNRGQFAGGSSQGCAYCSAARALCQPARFV
jgi:hypothetical protein